MAQIRIVDDWRRSPASGPSHYRSVMVIAEKWAEQRVLMRAYAESRDQLRPTIMLHGTELAIGPAGLDLNGPWGIHVGDNAEARAPHIKEQLETSARRLAGSKGNPPRLADEAPTFEREPTANWAPGAPRVVPARTALPPAVQHVAPIGAARIPQTSAGAYVVPPMQAQQVAAPVDASAAPSNPELRTAPLPRARGRNTRHPPLARTALGYTSGAGAQSAIVRLGLAPHVSARLGRLVDRIVPGDFHIDVRERRVLNALGEGELTARGIGHMLDVADPVSFMEELTRKLEAYSLDLVEPGDPQGGEPTYRLRA
ncbi:MAG TPA: hypothetical protein VHW23_27965 [Kofleriaceae bacterium]|nr:hypothetical protein [Kofleriaceae bacterium]